MDTDLDTVHAPGSDESRVQDSIVLSLNDVEWTVGVDSVSESTSEELTDMSNRSGE